MSDLLYLIHSRIFIPHHIFTRQLNLNNDYTKLLDNNKPLFNFVNIPIDKKYNLYHYKIEKYIIYVKYKPYCILKYLIGVNINILYTILKKKVSIPSKKQFFLLIRRNNNYYNDTLYKCLKFKPNSIVNYYHELVNYLINIENTTYADDILKSNIQKYKDIYIDSVVEKCYLHKNIVNTFIEFNGGILNTDDKYIKYKSILQLIKSNTNSKFSKVTLVISSYIFEWKQFLYKYYNKNDRILFINTDKQFEKYTYTDIINAQIVFISYNLLNNLFEQRKDTSNIDITINNILLDNNKINKHDQCNKYFYFIVYWKRLIIDNYETINNNLYLYGIIKNIKSYNRWVLTSYNKITNSIVNQISKYLINKEHNILYSNNFTDRVISFSLKNLNHLIKNKIIEETIELKYEPLPKPINYKKNYLEVKQLSSYLDYNSTYLSNLDINTTKECLICLNTISNNNIGLVRCGHIFCYSCCHNLKKCPICRGQIGNTDIVNIHQNKTDIIHNIRDTYDFKITYLCKNNINSNLVIISTDYNTIDILSNILQNLDINITNNLKKTFINSDNYNIICINYYSGFYISNWNKIDKIILWDISKDSKEYSQIINYINQQIVSIKKPFLKLENYNIIY